MYNYDTILIYPLSKKTYDLVSENHRFIFFSINGIPTFQTELGTQKLHQLTQKNHLYAFGTGIYLNGSSSNIEFLNKITNL